MAMPEPTMRAADLRRPTSRRRSLVRQTNLPGRGACEAGGPCRRRASGRAPVDPPRIAAERRHGLVGLKRHAALRCKDTPTRVAGIDDWAWQKGCLPRDNQGENRIASSRNAPQRPKHCLTRMLPSLRHFVNRAPTGRARGAAHVGDAMMNLRGARTTRRQARCRVASPGAVIGVPACPAWRS
jgi:hypothetical protein